MVYTKTLLFILLLVLALYALWPPAKIQGTEYYSSDTQDPGPASTITVVTPDELSRVIQATQAALSSKLGKCTYCIETTNISLTGNLYSGRFLFTVLPEPGGAPYGISVDSTVQKGSNMASGITLQSLSTIDTMDPYKQFKSGSDIQSEDTLPKLSDLQAAMGGL